MVMTRLMLFFAAHSASGTVACAAVKLVRTMKGDWSVTIESQQPSQPGASFDCVESGAVARRQRCQAEAGEHRSLVVDDESWAMRRVVSAVPCRP